MLEVRRVGGEAVPLPRAVTSSTLVAELRRHVASALDAVPSGIRLLVGTRFLDDSEEVGALEDGDGPAVVTVVVTGRGAFMLSGHEDGVVCIWDLPLSRNTSGARSTAPSVVVSMGGHGDVVHAVSVDWNTRRAVTASWDWSMHVWDFTSEHNLQCTGVLNGHRGPVHSVAADFGPSVRPPRAVSGSEDGTVRLWDLDALTCTAVFRTQHAGYAVHAVGMSLGEAAQWIVSGGRDAKLYVWGLQDRELHFKLEGHGSTIRALCMDPEGRHAISGAKDHRLRMWDLTLRQCTGVMEGHEQVVTAIAADFTLRRALSGSEDATLCLWDLQTMECLAVLKDVHGPVVSVSADFCSRTAVSGNRRGVLSVWDLDGGSCFHCFRAHEDAGCAYAVVLEK